jgi:hypothetical protein
MDIAALRHDTPKVTYRNRAVALIRSPVRFPRLPHYFRTGGFPPKAATVESRMGAAAHERSVSHPRSSNRTCGFPASGFPTGLIARPTAVIQRQNSKPPEDQVTGESLGSAAGHLMPPTEEMSDASTDVVINRPVCPVARSIAEVGRPAAQQTVQLLADI